MAAVTTELKVLVKVAGDKGLDRLSRSLTNIGKQAQASSVKFDQVAKRLQQVQRTSNNSIASLRNYRNAWRDIAEQVEIGSKEFRQATEEAKKLDAQIQKAQGRRQRGGAGGRLRAGAQIAGTVAGAGVFGGPEGAIGAALGAFAGPQGAIVGGAIGAQVGQLRQAAGAAAEYAASLQKLRIALFGVTTSQEEYGEALKFIAETTKTFAIPQDVVTRQFTKLQASVQGAGGNLEDTKVAFNGIVAAVRATGGSLADVDAALTATAQVFSKGKVSAEELRQQIGERLPGAFTLFAQSIGKTPQELDKALENGQVSLQDFQTFAEAIFKRYGETAQEIASGPESAGDRLSVALQELSAEVGNLLRPIGAAFQETFITIVGAITKATRALANFFKIGDRAVIEQNTLLIQATNKSIASIRKTIRDYKAETRADVGGIRAGLIAEQERTIAELEGKRERLRAEINRATRTETPDVAQTTPGTGLPGITLPAGGGGRAAREIVDLTQEQLNIELQIIEARKLGQAFNVIALEADRKILALDQKRIGANQKAVELAKITEETDRRVKDQLERSMQAIIDGIIKEQEELAKALQIEDERLETVREYNKLLEEQQTLADPMQGFKAGLDSYVESLGTAFDAVKNFTEVGLKGIGDAISELVTTGTLDFKKFAAGLLKEMSEIIVRGLFLRSILSIFGAGQPAVSPLDALDAGFSMGSDLAGMLPNAMGNAYAKNGIVPFAKGGVVDKPKIFPFANGIGLMGEAGPEAIMPLRRTSSGRLGVEATGGTSNIVVNVDASGTRVQGDDTRGKQLGGAISAAVQAELIKQRRPGGLLAS